MQKKSMENSKRTGKIITYAALVHHCINFRVK